MNQTVTPLIVPQPPAEEKEQVEAILQGVKEHLGFVPDAMKLYAISPTLLQMFIGNIQYFMGHQRLSQGLLASIRYLVSAKAGCQFCIDLNEGFLVNLGADVDTIKSLRDNPDNAPIDAKEKALLKFVLKAIEDPEAASAHDMDDLRAVGFSDRDIFDAVTIGANNRALNLVLKTFKVEEQGVFA